MQEDLSNNSISGPPKSQNTLNLTRGRTEVKMTSPTLNAPRILKAKLLLKVV